MAKAAVGLLAAVAKTTRGFKSFPLRQFFAAFLSYQRALEIMNPVVVCGRKIEVRGRVLRIAAIDGDYFRFFEDPVPVIAALREWGTRIDLFTFLQRLPETKPKYSY